MRALLAGLAVVSTAVAASVTASPAAAEAAPTAGTFTVVLADHSITPATLDAVQTAGGVVTSQIDEIGVLEVRTQDSKAFLEDVVGHDAVAHVGPSLTVQLDLPAVPSTAAGPGTAMSADPDDYLWNIERVTDDGAAWEREVGTKDVVVGVIDSGFDFGHPDLVGNIVPGSKTFVPGTEDAWDAMGHGTHVAGTVAANGGIKGVAPEVGLRAYRVFGTGGAAWTWLVEAVVAAANDRVDVINMSLGGPSVLGQWFYTDPDTGQRINLGNDAAGWVAYERAVRYAVERNVTVVAAAGNSGLNITNKHDVTRFYNDYLTQLGLDEYSIVGATFVTPALLPGVVTVSATGGGFGTSDRLAFYSNYGNGAVDVAAPGGDLGPDYPASLAPDYYKHLVLSTWPQYPVSLPCSGASQALWSCRYRWAAGTSMASPHVAGAAALVISEQLERTGSKPSPAEVVRTLRHSAEDLGRAGHDSRYGHGLVDAAAAVNSR